MGTSQQKSLFEDYEGFVEKFKPKKTTDDCYTPANIYEVVAEYVSKTYGIRREDMVRPFWPGGDYEAYDYPEGCVVVDNPPFSIITPICREYVRRGIRFFLFCPYLTCVAMLKGAGTGCSVIIAPASIRYDNGAEVATCFVTNLEPGTAIRSDPDLLDAIKAADDVNRKLTTKQVPKYEYPPEVLTATKVGWYAVHHTPYTLKWSDCVIISELDEQRRVGKSIFGNGFLLSERAAVERAAVERAAVERLNTMCWSHSNTERQLQKMITRKRP